MNHIDPNIHWYTGISRERGVRPRCPFASVHRCPRFYQSLSLLGGAGSTKIAPSEDQRLSKRWKKSDLWPATDEQATSIMGSPGRPIYSNFCPEVAYEQFGLFAVSFARYADEIDSDAAHAQLGRHGAPPTDWRWAWSSVAPLHYTECPLYSPLDLNHSSSEIGGKDQGPPKDVQQTLLRAIWNFPPFWRGVGVTILVLSLMAFAFRLSLPERTKEHFLGAFSTDTVKQMNSIGK